MKPKSKSALYDILVGILAALISFTILFYLPFRAGFVLMSPLPFIAGFIRGKDPQESALIKVSVMNSLYYLIFPATVVLWGYFYYNLVIIVALTGTALGIYARQHFSTLKLKVTGFSALFFVVVSLTGFWLMPVYFEAMMWTETREAATEYKLLSPEGDTLYSKDYAGKVVMIEFWATWCGPCKKQFPVMEKIVKRYKGNQQVSFLMVNSDTGSNSFDKASAFIKKSTYDLPFVIDIKGSTFKKFNAAVLPAVFIIDKKGVIVLRHTGYDMSGQFYDSMCSKLDSLIAH